MEHFLFFFFPVSLVDMMQGFLPTCTEMTNWKFGIPLLLQMPEYVNTGRRTRRVKCSCVMNHLICAKHTHRLAVKTVQLVVLLKVSSLQCGPGVWKFFFFSACIGMENFDLCNICEPRGPPGSHQGSVVGRRSMKYACRGCYCSIEALKLSESSNCKSLPVKQISTHIASRGTYSPLHTAGAYTAYCSSLAVDRCRVERRKSSTWKWCHFSALCRFFASLVVIFAYLLLPWQLCKIHHPLINLLPILH